jgi:2-polyprenyl-6-methoxyphenol hydroxylase-like FAD-dependent oxidoreductase
MGRDHAVVLGAGIAGLLAARVLAGAYGRVTVADRDPLPDAAGTRRGVPQGRHAHNLLPSGSAAIGELFPGLLDELEAGGAPVVRDFAELRFAPAGRPLRLTGPVDGPFLYMPSRPYLEGRLRARVRALPGVTVADRCEAVGLAATPARDRVTGVRLVRAGTAEVLDADLVVDATGRGGRAAAWLAELGCARPPEERLPVDVGYATRHLRLRPGDLAGQKFVAFGAAPDRPAGFVLFAQEGGQWVLTIFGYGAHHPPTDADGGLAFLARVAPPDVLAAVRAAEPLDGVVTHRFPTDVRRRWDRVRQLPAGLAAIGDAVCSSNPSYALGMSAAALQALALRDSLARGDRDPARRFLRAAARPADRAWQLATGADLALPHVEAPRPLPARLVGAYVERVLAAGGRDPVVAQRFVRVAALQDPLPRLLRPGTAARVLLGARGSAAAAGAPAVPVGR